MAECAKRKYTKKGAQMALLETKISRSLHNHNRRREQRIYYHRVCKAWHITSMPKVGNNGVGKAQVQEKSIGQSPMDATRTRAPEWMGHNTNQERED